MNIGVFHKSLFLFHNRVRYQPDLLIYLAVQHFQKPVAINIGEEIPQYRV